MLEKIKLALRINHKLLDAEILDLIESARAEMVRAGVLSEKVYIETDMLILNAIKAFVKMEYTTDMNKRDRFEESFKYQLDNLRKSEGYCV